MVKLNIGKRIERIRILKGIKQETIATELGLSQSAVSRLEHSEEIDKEKLGHIARILGVTPEMIENFNVDDVVNILPNSYNHADTFAPVNFQYDFNPFEKIVELYDLLLISELARIKALEELVNTLREKSKD